MATRTAPKTSAATRPAPSAGGAAAKTPRKTTPKAATKPAAKPTGKAPRGSRPAKGAAPASPPMLDLASEGVVEQMAGQVRSMAGRMLDLGAGALGAARGLQAASAVARSLSGGHPLDAARLAIQAVAAVGGPSRGAIKAGSALRKLREAAGFTVDEVSKALDLKDPALIEAVERGKAALPFELILRLAAILGRNDPVGFVMKMTRSANPVLWQTLEDLGVGRLLLQSARERAFANIYRGHDAARLLSDEEFAAVLAFSQAAFETAMAFHGRLKAQADSR